MTNPTTLRERTERLLAIREKATPGPWYVNESQGYYSVQAPFPPAVVCDFRRDEAAFADTRFIRSAHDMADHIRDLQAALDEALAAKAQPNGTVAQSICDVVDAWEIQGRTMIRLEDVQTLIEPLRGHSPAAAPPVVTDHEGRPMTYWGGLSDAALRARFDEESV